MEIKNSYNDHLVFTKALWCALHPSSGIGRMVCALFVTSPVYIDDLFPVHLIINMLLQMSTLSVAPFFVENISELQLNSLKLVTRVRFSSIPLHMIIFGSQNILFVLNFWYQRDFLLQLFSRYEKHRQLIMEDILSSLARLPSSKKNLRNYRYF